MLFAKQGLVPPDGFFFKEMDGAVLKGRSWLEVERKVVKYRKINKFPMGEPLKEILEQAKIRNPTLFWEKRVRGE